MVPKKVFRQILRFLKLIMLVVLWKMELLLVDIRMMCKDVPVLRSEIREISNLRRVGQTLKKTEISTTLPSGEKSTVVMEIVSAKARHILPAKMFNIE